RYIIIYLSSTLTPTIPFLILLINNEFVSPITLIISSFPIIVSFIFLSYLFRDSITRDPNPIGILYYISKLSKYLLPTFGFFYYLSIISFISLELLLISDYFKIVTSFSFLIPYIIMFTFLVFNLFNINIESKIQEIISYISVISLIILILLFTFPIDINIQYNHIDPSHIDPFLFIIAYNISVFSGLDILTYYSNHSNSRKTGNATFYGTIFLSIISIFLYISLLNIKIKDLSNMILLIFLPISIYSTYIWFYTANKILENISENRLLPYFFRIKNNKNSPIFNIFLSTSIILIFLSLNDFGDLLSFFSSFTIIIYVLYVISYIKIKVEGKNLHNWRLVKIFIAVFSMTILSYMLLYNFLNNIYAVILTLSISLIVLITTLKITWKKDTKLTELYFSKFHFLPYLIRKLWYKEDIKIIEYYIKDGYKILDFGPFLGDITIHIARKYNVKVYALEISQKIAKKLQEKTKNMNNFFVYITKKDEIPKIFYNNIDLIIIYETLKFVVDKNKFAKGIYRALKNNGYLISITYADFLEKKDTEDEIKKMKELLEYHNIKTLLIKTHKRLYTKYILIGKKI
ncbi:MAG: methyltransferase domain-containing protein, partial [Candidatus Nanopusillus sp.]